MNEKKNWELTHGKTGYSNRIFSLLNSNLVLKKFKSELLEIKTEEGNINILIPGCGSNVNLQICCNNALGGRAIINALDWSKEAINISKTQTDNLGINVNYYNQSYYELSLKPSSFDIILMSNAIVSESHENNINAIKNLTRLLKPNGHLIGLLPSPFNMLDYALSNSDAHHWLTDGTLNIEGRSVYERDFGKQRFFSPLELHMLFKELKCQVEKFELFFYDDDDFAEQISKLYDIEFNNNYCFWGYFIKTKKM